jgi:hypothetical protein
MTLPGADTINGGIIGEDCFLSSALLVLVPLALGLFAASFGPAMLTRRGISRVGEGVGDESEGVSM